MDAIRHALGITTRPEPAPVDYEEIEARLRERLLPGKLRSFEGDDVALGHRQEVVRLRDQAARLKAMDAQVDAQRTSAHILHPHRRATDPK
jgi:hypothetical protein